MGIFSRLRASPYTIPTLKALTWVPVVFFVLENGVSTTRIDGRSMQPTFNPDSNELKRDVVLVNKWAATGHSFQRGQVVVLTSPNDPKRKIIKRIIALQGDTIKPRRGNEEVYIPKGHCWIEGDEKFHSNDSNTYGPVPISLITSIVSHIVWPLDRYGPVEVKGVETKRVKVGFIAPDSDDDYCW
ncbi:peptidase S24/S26A/S26B/S26C [Phycomyces nitens]|nr:peptidase S24/S26A/S26B/S26C [Phycomyces nitens]